MSSQLEHSLKANNAATGVKALEGGDVYLYNIDIGDESSKALATALESNDTITTIYLGYNQIVDKGTKALATALESNDTITSISVTKLSIR